VLIGVLGVVLPEMIMRPVILMMLGMILLGMLGLVLLLKML